MAAAIGRRPSRPSCDSAAEPDGKSVSVSKTKRSPSMRTPERLPRISCRRPKKSERKRASSATRLARAALSRSPRLMIWLSSSASRASAASSKALSSAICVRSACICMFSAVTWSILAWLASCSRRRLDCTSSSRPSTMTISSDRASRSA